MKMEMHSKLYLWHGQIKKLPIVTESNSCGKRNMHQHMYDNRQATHCGHCMPCMYRKASLIGEIDNTTYGNHFITLYKKREIEFRKISSQCWTS